jgi:hypothetical protein
MRRAALLLLVLFTATACSNSPAVSDAPAPAPSPQEAYIAAVFATSPGDTNGLRRNDVLTAGRNACMSIGTAGVTQETLTDTLSRQYGAPAGGILVDTAARVLCPERQFSTEPPPPFDLVGGLRLADPDGFTTGPGGIGCQGSGGYSDLRPGSGVTVQDASGTIVAVGSLTIGVPSGGGCDLYFEVPDLPTSDFYQIEVGNRGTVTFTEEQAHGGEVMLTIGG